MKRTVKTYQISWAADHEQYWQGHGVAFSDYDECVTGNGPTLRDAFEDALEGLAQSDIEVTPELESNLKTLLIGEIRNGRKSVLSIDIADKRFGYCTSRKTAKHKEDCSVCSGDWHFYVSIDYTLQDEPLPETFTCPKCKETISGPIAHTGMLRCVWCHTLFEASEVICAQ